MKIKEKIKTKADVLRKQTQQTEHLLVVAKKQTNKQPSNKTSQLFNLAELQNPTDQGIKPEFDL